MFLIHYFFLLLINILYTFIFISPLSSLHSYSSSSSPHYYPLIFTLLITTLFFLSSSLHSSSLSSSLYSSSLSSSLSIKSSFTYPCFVIFLFLISRAIILSSSSSSSRPLPMNHQNHGHKGLYDRENHFFTIFIITITLIKTYLSLFLYLEPLFL